MPYTRDVQVSSFAPSARLAPILQWIRIIETTDEATRVLLPEPGITLGVRYAGGASLVVGGELRRVPNASLTGILDTARTMRTHAGSGVVLARFHETGAARLFPQPLHELAGRTVDLGALMPRAELERVTTRLAEAATHAARIEIFEAFLVAGLSTAAADPIVVAAVRTMRSARGALRIGALAHSLGISQDPLEKRFRREVGTSPKRLASLIRLHHVAIRAQQVRPHWSRLAIEAGYYDQAHLIREFRAATGSSPARFFRSAAYC